MKAIKVNFLNSLLSMVAIAMLLSSCTQSSNNAQAQSTPESPKVDIHTAVLSGDLEAVKQHIKAGTDLNGKEPMSNSTPLMTATAFGKNEIAKALIDAGADLTPTNNDGATVLHTAAFFGRIEIVQMLIEANVDKSARNNFGATARESVMGPYEQVKPIYEMLQKQMQPLGLQLDFEELQKARPVIAMMLQ